MCVCPHCGNQLQIPASLAGTPLGCPICKKHLAPAPPAAVAQSETSDPLDFFPTAAEEEAAQKRRQLNTPNPQQRDRGQLLMALGSGLIAIGITGSFICGGEIASANQFPINRSIFGEEVARQKRMERQLLKLGLALSLCLWAAGSLCCWRGRTTLGIK